MRVLFLVQDQQKVILDSFYDAVAKHCECDLRRLSGSQQADLRRYFSNEVDVHYYDRILLFLRFKKELKQIDFIRTLPNLVVLEHDACQNYVSGKYRGLFLYYYKNISGVRVVCSGFGLARRLRESDIDAVCVPKGYNQNILFDKKAERSIELGFIGSLEAAVYSNRARLLEEISRKHNLKIFKTDSGSDYCDGLNRIKFFVNADVGFGEYMIKNFEAMACGCVLFTYNQGSFENENLGFVDMENVVLFNSLYEFSEKLCALRKDPELATRIAEAGKKFSASHHSFHVLGSKVVEALCPPLRNQTQRRPRNWAEVVSLRWQLFRGRLG